MTRTANVASCLTTRLVLALAIGALSSCSPERTAPTPPGDVEPAFAWVELGPEGRVQARAIVGGTACPRIQHDSTSELMVPRSETPPPGFEDILVCESPISPGTTTAAIGSQTLALPVAEPRRIAVVGDTGCRIKGDDIQNCTGLGTGPAWNFAQVADAIAAVQPDLVLHVGDYLYRETGCPSGNRNCEGSPYGHNWAAWKADFFEPARELLPRVPWVFVRGNHEDCERAWRGWALFFDPGDLPGDPWSPAGCQDYTDPYRVPIGDLAMVVMDTSEIPDDYAATPNPATVARYAREFTLMERLIADDRTAWLTTHRPFWAVASYVQASAPRIAATDLTLQAAVRASAEGGIPPTVEMVLAGHVHLFQLLRFDDGRPPQLVFGGGATELDPAITETLLASDPSVAEALGVAGDQLQTAHDVSFGVIDPLDRDESGWWVTLKGATGADQATFSITGDR